MLNCILENDSLKETSVSSADHNEAVSKTESGCFFFSNFTKNIHRLDQTNQ